MKNEDTDEYEYHNGKKFKVLSHGKKINGIENKLLIDVEYEEHRRWRAKMLGCSVEDLDIIHEVQASPSFSGDEADI